MTVDQLDKLHTQMNSCRLCIEAGYSISPRAIYSGKYGAKVMIVGQASGITETEAGRPFNAGSGTRLFDWLEKAGFEEHSFRAEQYMTSVTKCFPGKSKSGGGDRIPSRQEQELCRSYLDCEIQIVDPRLIIPVGRLAINLFYPQKISLAEIIGSEKVVDHRAIVPFSHPSGASRWHQIAENREKIAEAIKRIGRLKSEMGI